MRSLTSFKKLAMLAVAVAAVFVGVSAINPAKAEAAVVNEVREFVGVLVENTNPAYTHKVGNIDLILNSSHNVNLGKTVVVRVQYYTTTHFRVLSVTPVTTEVKTVVYTRTNQRVFTGVLEESKDEAYTHTLKDIDLNMILNEENVEEYVGSEVRVTVEYYSGWNFRVLSVIPTGTVVAEEKADEKDDEKKEDTKKEDDKKTSDTKDEEKTETVKEETTKVASFTGTLLVSGDARYTHRLGGYNLNLILNSYYNRYVGTTVTVKVEYVDAVNFRVVSVTPATPAPAVVSTGYVYGDVVEFTGVLEYSASPAYTHQIGTANFILNATYNAYVGQSVVIRVMYLDSVNFKVLSVSLV